MLNNIKSFFKPNDISKEEPTYITKEEPNDIIELGKGCIITKEAYEYYKNQTKNMTEKEFMNYFFKYNGDFCSKYIKQNALPKNTDEEMRDKICKINWFGMTPDQVKNKMCEFPEVSYRLSYRNTFRKAIYKHYTCDFLFKDNKCVCISYGGK